MIAHETPPEPLPLEIAKNRSKAVSSYEVLVPSSSFIGDVQQLPQPRPSTLLRVTSFIIATEFCERLAYYGLDGSLVLLFSSHLGMTNAQADSTFALWSGACYVTPLLGGWLADSYMGRYAAILTFSAIYGLGLILVTAGTIPGAVSPFFIFLGIYSVALGTGGIKPNVSTFGAEQFDMQHPQDVREKDSFFSYFYWSINLGALTSYIFIGYVCQYGLPFMGGQPFGFVVGYSLPCIAMALAVGVFVLGSKRYRHTLPPGSVLVPFIGIVKQASWDQWGVVLEQPSHWLSKAKRTKGGTYQDSQVDGVIAIWRLFPLLLLQIPYWLIYSLQSTIFQNQGCQLDLEVGAANVPVAFLEIFDSVAVLVLIPLFDQLIFPLITKLQGSPPSMLKKMAWGIGFAASAVVCAGLLEVARKHHLAGGPDGPFPIGVERISHCHQPQDYNPREYQRWFVDQGMAAQPAHCTQLEGCSTYEKVDGVLTLAIDCIRCNPIPQASTLSVLWQIPQFLLIGTSETLAAVTAMEFFFQQSPASMKSVAAALNLITTALGSWLSIPLLAWANSGSQPWLTDDLNQGHLEHYFFTIAALTVVALVAFVRQSQRYMEEDKDPGWHEQDSQSDEEDLSARAGLEAPLLKTSEL